MTDEFKRDREVIDAATPGEWQRGTAGNCNLVSFDGDNVVGICIGMSERNIAFVARARTRWPAALDALTESRLEAETWERTARERHARVELLERLLGEACRLADIAGSALHPLYRSEFYRRDGARISAIRIEAGLPERESK